MTWFVARFTSTERTAASEWIMAGKVVNRQSLRPGTETL